MVRMFGWFSAATERASCSKRLRRSPSLGNVAGRILMATSRPSRASRALYTSPMPPAPTSDTISYGPSFVPAGRAKVRGLYNGVVQRTGLSYFVLMIAKAEGHRRRRQPSWLPRPQKSAAEGNSLLAALRTVLLVPYSTHALLQQRAFISLRLRPTPARPVSPRRRSRQRSFGSAPAS